jgi:U6 snRNA-associated Sm-like protein LSm2
MLFYSFFRRRLGEEVEIVLKSNITLKGKLTSVDTFLTFKLKDVVIGDQEAYPGLKGMDICSIKGSSVKYASIRYDEESAEMLNAASRHRITHST